MQLWIQWAGSSRARTAWIGPGKVGRGLPVLYRSWTVLTEYELDVLRRWTLEITKQAQVVWLLVEEVRNWSNFAVLEVDMPCNDHLHA